MSSEKVRIINEKGEARLVMPHIARDKKIMKSYGYRIQDLKEKESEAAKYVECAVNEMMAGFQNNIEQNQEAHLLDLLEVRQPEKPQRGRKPNVKK
jgi:hypothetical protein